MKDLNYTPEQLIAECEMVKTSCTNAIVTNENAVDQNNKSIENLLQRINDFNTEINKFKADNAQRSENITNLYNRIAMEDAIINNYLKQLK